MYIFVYVYLSFLSLTIRISNENILNLFSKFSGPGVIGILITGTYQNLQFDFLVFVRHYHQMSLNFFSALSSSIYANVRHNGKKATQNSKDVDILISC